MRTQVVVLIAAILLEACANLDTRSFPAQTIEPTIVVTPKSTKLPLEIVSNPNYMQGCRNEYGQMSSSSQAIYKDIIPGKTLPGEVSLQLGDPPRTYEGQSYDFFSSAAYTWEYDEYAIFFYHDVVQYVLASDMEATLEELVKAYGCPTVIYHYYDYPEESRLESDYFYFEPVNVTIFSIPSVGFEFTFQGYPIALDSIPDHVLFFQPISVEEYISWNLDNHSTGGFVDWQEAVR